ncbi:hypothetical protein BT63DRAFT_21847 [Microthyrium microscopicum]|uniref:GDP/GTP exchange factor Sec2 N-terminal domain-containing protein n=1 Tax=Microthyrium microscopicum TaxID=703497 RepID=A0A6A6UTR5_9PEZI|nr:hypothetical protein BT63DRAFT_21847 [Microthyrium microscopicum]
MATVVAKPAPPPLPPRDDTFPPEPDMLNLNPDPRTPSSASTVSRNDSVVDSTNGDVNEELSKLSDKLVDAINHQASLDDTLQQTKLELERARKRIEELEANEKDHAAKLQCGLLVTKTDIQRREAKIMSDLNLENMQQQNKITADFEQKHTTLQRETEATLSSERELRLKAEQEKKDMEMELETLTSALFTEANTMVADARRAKEVSDKKIEHLKIQLQDSEVLLQSHQDQLQDLKSVLEKMTSEHGDGESVTRSSTNPPSSPAVANDRVAKMFESAHFTGNEGAEETLPDHPLHFSHLIQPVLRTDVNSYEEFSTLIKQARAASPPPSRVVSGNYSSLNGLNNSAGSTASNQNQTSAISGLPNTIGNSSPRTSVGPQLPVLRETKVFKRALTEDIEPTLRLDIAPGVSWMVRRPILTAMIDGSLVVEPMPPPPVKFRGPINQCSLCGENRAGELHARKHRFRISEDRETRRFPLCDLCLGRLRSCGDLLSFLRMVSGGHWRADSEEEIKSAWEEYVKLRERMFWHRMSGGVIPVSRITQDNYVTSPRHSVSTVHGGARKESSGEDPFVPTETNGTASESNGTDSADDNSSRQRPERLSSGEIEQSIPGGFASSQ